MSASQFLQYFSWVIYLLIFVVTAIQAARRPTRASLDIALFFGVLALVILQSWLFRALGIRPPRFVGALAGSLVMALPYLLLRLVNDFAVVPRLVLRLAEAGLALSVACLFLLSPLPAGAVVGLALYFCALSVYSARAFFRQSRRASGVTRRRMQAIAAGSVCLGLVILNAGLVAAFPAARDLLTIAISQPLTVASALAYFFGFAPPATVRRAWQEPELRAFLAKAASLPRLPDTLAIARELERGTADSLGAPYASIGLWDPDAEALRFPTADDPTVTLRPGEMIVGRAFAEQRPIFAADAAREDPAHADRYRAYEATAVLAAPITAGEQRLGVLATYAPRAPIFAEEDLRLLQLLADQAAVIFESRALIDEATRVRAREEATRLKDDFLSAAAHDLKTPLTTLVASAELLERRARRNPDAPPDLRTIGRLVSEAQRLNTLVLDLLDASRVEQRRLLGPREEVDLVALARESVARQEAQVDDGRHRFAVEADGAVVGRYDRTRLEQLLANLLENAVKYSPDGGEVRARVWREGELARLSVSDQGIGIPAADLPHVFERFHRGANVNDRRFAGMGLGLYICQGIVEQHGGRIWATSAPGQGTTFEVALPLEPRTDGAEDAGAAAIVAVQPAVQAPGVDAGVRQR